MKGSEGVMSAIIRGIDTSVEINDTIVASGLREAF